MTRKNRVTIKDVARVAKVTPQTVSRAFRDAKDISEETKNKILKIANEMGYVRNSSATSLRSGASKLIAVIYDNLMNSYFSILIYYLQCSLKELGYSIMAIAVTDTHLNGRAYLSALEHNVDGVIIFLQINEEIPKLIKTYNVPILIVGRRTDENNIDCICVDDVTIGKLAAQRFLKAGCKNPICVNEALEIDCAYDRYLGFKKEFEAHGIDVHLIANTLGCKLTLEEPLLNAYKTHKPDSVFCFNDMLAFETLYLVEKHQLSLPKIIGVDNIQQEIYFPKRLTTIGWDKEDFAKKAAKMMVNRIKEGPGLGLHVTESVYLVEGVTS